VAESRESLKATPCLSKLGGDLHPDLVQPLALFAKGNPQAQSPLQGAVEVSDMIGGRLREIKGLGEAPQAKAQDRLPPGFILAKELRRLRDIVHKTGKALPLGQHPKA
jgi:hypothetical protein